MLLSFEVSSTGQGCGNHKLSKTSSELIGDEVEILEAKNKKEKVILINNSKKAALISVSILLLLIIISLIFVYVQTVSVINGMLDYRSPERPYEDTFALNCEEVNFLTKDGLNIYGQLFTPNSPKGIVILAPGWDMTHTSMYDHVLWLYENGYASLDLDLRTRGKSDGNTKGAGYTEVFDVEAAITYIETRLELKDLPMALIGHSLGGNTVLKVQHPDIRATIDMSGYTDFIDMVGESVDNQPVLETLVPFFAKIHIGLKFGFSNINSAINVSSRQDAAIMVVHGRNDTQVPFSNGEKLSQALADKEGFMFLPVENCMDHFPWLNEDSTINVEVIDEMISFLDKNLSPSE